jgi:CheY-like chemotaxis protein
VRRILLVDDSKSARDALQAILEPYGFEIHQAENGAVALQRLRAAPFDLAFVDLHMPVLDGPNLVRLMRAQGVATQVILVTVGAATPVVTATIKLGARDYVTKPFTPERIMEALTRALGLDPDALRIRPARVLLQHPDRTVAAQLRALLPPHVELDATPALARALELAEQREHALVLLDAAVLEGDAEIAAGLVRKLLPLAGIFALADGASPARPWDPQDGLDGILPRALDEELVRGFLYANFLRPLVFAEGPAMRTAGFEGPPHHLPAYFAALARAVAGRCARETPTQDLCIDLSRAPPDADRLASLMNEVRGRLDLLGLAPAFRVTEPLRGALAARPELGRVVIL